VILGHNGVAAGEGGAINANLTIMVGSGLGEEDSIPVLQILERLAET
jgi:3-hydroxyisobutyrate dehydrogenase-like beta-hydroxyacid dehydrogenase